MKVSDRLTQGNVKFYAKRIIENAKLDKGSFFYTVDRDELIDNNWTVEKPSDLSDITDSMWGFIIDIIRATIYVERFAPKHVTERIRSGFIGKEIVKDGITYYQHEKGQPFGTLVSISDGSDGVSVGVDVLDKNDNLTPRILSEYRAIRDAENRLEKFGGGVYMYRKDEPEHEVNYQLDHFYTRSLAYFIPEKYSYSRGSVPVTYKNFDKIHETQEKILGQKKIREQMSRLSTEEMHRIKFVGNAAKQEDVEAHSDAQDGTYLLATSDFILYHNSKVKIRTKKKYNVLKGDWLIRKYSLWELCASQNLPKDLRTT